MAMGENKAMRGGPEQVPGLQAERIDRMAFARYYRQIRSLRYDAMHPELDRAPTSVRNDKLSPIKRRLYQPGEYDQLFVVKNGLKVVGFLAVETRPRDRHAQIREMWTAQPGAAQREVAGALLREAHTYLPEHHYQHLRYGAEGKPSAEFRRTTSGALGRFVKKERSESEPEAESKEASQKGEVRADDVPDETPEAPDDGILPLEGDAQAA